MLNIFFEWLFFISVNLYWGGCSGLFAHFQNQLLIVEFQEFFWILVLYQILFGKYSLPFCCFGFQTFNSVSCRGEFLILTKFILPIFSSVGYDLVVYLKTHYQNQTHLDSPPYSVFFSPLHSPLLFFLFYSFTFRSVTYFDLIFVKVVRFVFILIWVVLGVRARDVQFF